MSPHTPNDQGAAMAEVREEARRLAAELDGPLRRIHLRSGDVQIDVEWEHVGPRDEVTPAAAADREPDPEPDTGRQLVVSPMVGTFYRAPEPGAAPFVGVGDAVEPGQVIGIVEAMKLMNPIVTEVAGTVSEVLVDNGEPVEFARPLVAVVPA